MEFKRNNHDGGWSGECHFRGVKIAVTIDAELWNSDPREVVECAVGLLETRWLAVLRSITTSVFPLYNASWADSSSGFPRLPEEDFLRCLSVTDLSVGDDSLHVAFSAGDLFAGHSVTVFIDGDAAPIAMIEG